MTPKERAAMKQALSTDEALMALEIILKDGIEHGGWPLNKNCEDGLSAITALREALDHSGEANEMVGCAYCNNPLFAGTKCNNCGRITLAEQADGEQWSPDDMAYRPSGLSMEQADREALKNLVRDMRIDVELKQKVYAALAEQAEQEPVEFRMSEVRMKHAEQESLRECRHCGWLCTPYVKQSKKFYPLEQAEQEHDGHWSDCSVHNEPAYPNGPCDCGGYPPKHWRCACGANLYIDSNGAPASKAEQAEQKPVAYLCPSFVDNFATGRYETCEQKDYGAFPVYAAPVRTKNLTDDEILGWIDALPYDPHQLHLLNFARAVIAADRSKNGII